MPATVKKIAISLGLYKPARALHRALNRAEREHFNSHRKLLSEFISAGDLAFDVGANIGTRTEIMLSLGARVVAFEPQPECAREIRARGNERLTVVEKAVGPKPGTADLHIKTASAQSSLLAGWQGGDDIEMLSVPVTTLDAEIAKFGSPAFCKIDVEGFEAEALRGLTSHIRAVSLEYHCSPEGIAKMRDCVGQLTKLASYEFNLIGGEESEWLLLTWRPAEEFFESFPKCAAPHFLGDIFFRQT
jgi:FkbM family methyltransferase